uniref:Proteinase inhibitor I32, inhibitor of apoptosis,domain-containing protein n=1 Tax=Schistosoma japonicum TaxID=6182 RepID=C1LAE7_SCHJA|nr:Proteinase inhibitor I32, inhibitor of apoptosis,domain-containing protein [Schistosoma japonicum]
MSYFQNLSNALDDTFSATVQSEDELDYSSATLVLAGLLQIHSRTPRYAFYQARLDSFSKVIHQKDASKESPLYRSQSLVPSPSELASAGFFHTGSGDETVCPACGLGLRDWQATDQPEACHIAYSAAATAAMGMGSGDGHCRPPIPTMPCLYLVVHRLLVSEIPLARKSLVPVGQTQSVRGLPGVISRPLVHFSDESSQNTACEYPSLAERLYAIAHIMTASPAPQGWPVENARALGHSDDLIVLALWRLQAEAAGMGLACPPTKSIYIDPQATTELLKAILRVQEGYDTSSRNSLEFYLDAFDEEEVYSTGEALSEGSEGDITAEDAETAALSRCRRYLRPQQQQFSDSTSSPRSAESYRLQMKKIHLPRFYQFLVWWSHRWPATHSNNVPK